jgi:hypothetical protein
MGLWNLRLLQCKGDNIMNSELRYLLKTNSNCEGCSDQQSLGNLLSDLRAVAIDLDLDFNRAADEAETLHQERDPSAFDPCI